jgi:hypothetical protein
MPPNQFRPFICRNALPATGRATSAMKKNRQFSTIETGNAPYNLGCETAGRHLLKRKSALAHGELNPRSAVTAAKGQVADATYFIDKRRCSESQRSVLNRIETEKPSGDDLSAIQWLDWSGLPRATTRTVVPVVA